MDFIASLSMQLPLRKASSLQKHATRAENATATQYLPWGKPAIASKEQLANELQSLYWGGIRRELAQMILTLREWQQPQCSSLELEEESRFQVEGYEPFIAQVGESSQDFARKYNQDRLRRAEMRKGNKTKMTYEVCSQLVLNAYRKDYEDQRLERDIRNLLPKRGDESIQERRARMLLQSASFLDIDKVITYNAPLPRANFWRRSAPPQLTLARFEASSMPKLKALRCKACGDVIRGVLFKCLDRNCQAAVPLTQKDSICETCFRRAWHPQSHMTKFYKHLILRDIITPRVGRRICVCDPDMGNAPKSWRSSLFPIDDNFLHRGKGRPKVLKCGLLLLSDRVMEAKYQGTISSIEKRKKQIQKRRQKKTIDKKEVQPTSKKGRLGRSQTRLRGRRYKNPQGKGDEKTTSDVEDEKLASKEIPLLYRKFTNRYPFGNVHIALMFGPLMIENGVPE